MTNIGLVGIGVMGCGHLDVYLRLMEDDPSINLVSICDIDEKKFKNQFKQGEFNQADIKYDFSSFNLYNDSEEMMEKDDLDIIDIVLPTVLHSEIAVKAMRQGINVLCEKPMARNLKQCEEMISASRQANKKLMIAHCLRFWPAYMYLKEAVDSGRLGEVMGAYFFRGGSPPVWSYQNWLLDKEKSGGAIFDEHIHDTDMIQWLFGTPMAVGTIAKNVIPGSGYDFVSTNYIFDNGPAVNAQDDWSMKNVPFSMCYRVNFKNGSLIFENGRVTERRVDGTEFEAEISLEMGYYFEIEAFIDCVKNDKEVMINPDSSAESIRIIEAEIASADNHGRLEYLD